MKFLPHSHGRILPDLTERPSPSGYDENGDPLPAERSFEPLTETDLTRLIDIFQDVLKNEIARTAVGGEYVDRLMLLALCQGGAQHYLDGKSGVKDLDVWAFFREKQDKPFPYRTIWRADFGPSRFGRHPHDLGYRGRRVDVLGRSLSVAEDESERDAVLRWLCRTGKSTDALRHKPVIGLFPELYFGKLIWTPPPSTGE